MLAWLPEEEDWLLFLHLQNPGHKWSEIAELFNSSLPPDLHRTAEAIKIKITRKIRDSMSGQRNIEATSSLSSPDWSMRIEQASAAYLRQALSRTMDQKRAVERDLEKEKREHAQAATLLNHTMEMYQNAVLASTKQQQDFLEIRAMLISARHELEQSHGGSKRDGEERFVDEGASEDTGEFENEGGLENGGWFENEGGFENER
ncbi:uncharacterized protein BDV17DRAFT_166898 [Aspergillus undulatus]|uniref:uncharacterized protein n=1 Tax=Aspergillus undulatus TaxID=1810928 RepID=UPI003CCDDC1D